MNSIRKSVPATTTAILIVVVAGVAHGSVTLVPFCEDFYAYSYDWGSASGTDGSFHSTRPNQAVYHAEMIAADWGLVNVGAMSFPLYGSCAGGYTRFMGRLYPPCWWLDFYLDGPLGSYADVTLDWEFWVQSDVMAFAFGKSYVHSQAAILSYSGGPVTPMDTHPNQVVRSWNYDLDASYVGFDVEEDYRIRGSYSLGRIPVGIPPNIDLPDDVQPSRLFLLGEFYTIANADLDLFGVLEADTVAKFSFTITAHEYVLAPQPIPLPGAFLLSAVGVGGTIGLRRWRFWWV
jgi:hypothetical protein